MLIHTECQRHSDRGTTVDVNQVIPVVTLLILLYLSSKIFIFFARDGIGTSSKG